MFGIQGIFKTLRTSSDLSGREGGLVIGGVLGLCYSPETTVPETTAGGAWALLDAVLCCCVCSRPLYCVRYALHRAPRHTTKHLTPHPRRCLVKNLESLRVHYDSTVRDDADGSIVQFLYGEDGLDVTAVSYMTSQLGFLAANAPRFAQGVDLGAAAGAAKVRGAWRVACEGVRGGGWRARGAACVVCRAGQRRRRVLGHALCNVCACPCAPASARCCAHEHAHTLRNVCPQ